MQVTIGELAAIVGGQVAAEVGDRVITGVSSIAEAGESDLTFFGNARYLPRLRSSRAAAVLVPRGFAERIAPVPIEVENPSFAFAQVLERFTPPRPRPTPGVHPSAVVAPDAEIAPSACILAQAVVEAGAKIGAGTIIGPLAYVGPGVRIGADCLLHPRVTLAEGTLLGDRVILHSGVVVGSDGFGYELVAGRHVKIPQTGSVQIDDDVEIGANTTIDRARFGRTWIQTGVKIDNLVQIAHNVVIGAHSVIVAQAGISGSSKLGSYVTLAGQVGMVGHIEIGDRAIIGAQSGVSKNVPAGEIWLGSPAVAMDEQKDRLAYVARLGKLFARVKELETSVRRIGPSDSASED